MVIAGSTDVDFFLISVFFLSLRSQLQLVRHFARCVQVHRLSAVLWSRWLLSFSSFVLSSTPNFLVLTPGIRKWSSYFPLMTLGFGEVLWEWWCLVRCGRRTVSQLVRVHHHDKIIALHATPKSNHNYICKLWVNWRWKCLIRRYEAS